MPPSVRRTGITLLAIGVVLAGVVAAVDRTRFFANALVLGFFVLTLGTGSLFFVALEFVVNSTWTIPFRRIAEHLAVLVPVGLVALAIALFGVFRLYAWTDPAVVAASDVLQKKTAYLNLPFFAIRMLAYAALWLVSYLLLVSRSRRQDTTRDAATTRAWFSLSPIFMIVFAITMTFAAIDLLMSLTPHWSSSLFGPYIGVTAIVAGVAATTFAASSLKLQGLLDDRIGPSHFYGLGALLFALTTLAAYMAFAQFLLIWYGNLPDETIWYTARQQGYWLAVFLLLCVSQFVIPFVALMPKPAKSKVRRLRWVAAWVLAAHGLELYWIVLPGVPGVTGGPVWWPEVGFPIAAVGVTLLAWLYSTSRAPRLPVGDPRLERAFAYRG